ncbi:Translation factor GUF1-like, mitochondrial [Vitis vinifera]|uniref:Translation factor GUF1 homolog, mitochondrial n=3 Tax=Magnoliopsida TaxID=3398 RepID=A0A438GHH3_VITVI|nr:Translation factor GUF1-like, mitochondrial [Vitis vinifera]
MPNHQAQVQDHSPKARLDLLLRPKLLLEECSKDEGKRAPHSLSLLLPSLLRSSDMPCLLNPKSPPGYVPFSPVTGCNPVKGLLGWHHFGWSHTFCSRSLQNSRDSSVDLSQYPPERIRNFSIIAHVDHGKSTLADRLLELTGTIKRGHGQPQYLDKLQVERERGITVKAQTATMFHRHNFDGPDVTIAQESPSFLLNLIDTPGHVDFSYEVSRSLAACQGVLLVVDAAQGVQAQTVANFYLAFESNLTIIPVINKIDQPTADPDHVKAQLKSMFDLDPRDALLTSAKTGQGLEQVLPAVIERIPPPPGKSCSPLRMLLLDSYYDEYKGVICHVAVVDGALRKGDKISSSATGHTYEVFDVGIMHPELKSTGVLLTGQVGYVVSGMRSTKEARVGDTLHHNKSIIEPLPGIVLFYHPFLGLVGKGTKVSFWTDHWCGNEELAQTFPQLFELAVQRNASVNEMWDSSLGQGGWNIRLSRNLNDWELDALGELLQLLRDLRTSHEEDAVIWKGESHGLFRIQDAYKLLAGSNVISFPKKGIWVDKVPTKVAFFAWEASWEKVLTLDKLQRRGWQFPNRCFLCGCEEENVNHILLHCTVVRALWEIVLALFGANWVFPEKVKDMLGVYGRGVLFAYRFFGMARYSLRGGFKPAKHMVFSGLYPADGSDFEALNHAIERLTCNDASVSVTKESSTALGLGFRCGFLGLLHMDVFHQRLEQEYGAHIISTVPTVPYIFEYSDGSKIQVQNPAALASNPGKRVTACWEPTVIATIIIPSEYVGPVITLCSERRGEQLEYSFIDSQRAFMKYRLPLREIVVDFYNELKSITSGYASFDYEDAEPELLIWAPQGKQVAISLTTLGCFFLIYQASDLVKLDILLNGQPVDAMATIVHNLKAQRVGRELVEKLKKFIDRQMFEIVIQAAIGSKIIARETISAMRKNVLAKCYGGDVTRKRKLLEKQKEGKKRMKRVGSVDIPQEAFHELLKVS